MKPTLLLFAVSFLYFSCNKEYESPCKIETYHKSSFLGEVIVCFDTPEEVRFPARAHINIRDSILLVSIVSLDTTTNWYLVDSAITECYVWEGWAYYLLHSLTEPVITGTVSGTFNYHLQDSLCEESLFTGQLEE